MSSATGSSEDSTEFEDLSEDNRSKKVNFEDVSVEDADEIEAEKDTLDLGENEDIPELAVEALDAFNKITFAWAYKVSILNKQERSDHKQLLARIRMADHNGVNSYITPYETYLVESVEETIENEKKIPLTDKEKLSLKEKISRILKDKKIKVHNPILALWGTLFIIMLSRILPVLMNLADKMMSKNDKPKREMGKTAETEDQKKHAA